MPKMAQSGTIACSMSNSSSQRYELRFEGDFRQNCHIAPILAQISPIWGQKMRKIGQSENMACCISTSTLQRYGCRFEGHFRQIRRISPLWPKCLQLGVKNIQKYQSWTVGCSILKSSSQPYEQTRGLFCSSGDKTPILAQITPILCQI